jgi:hypothetical protein
VTLFDNRYHFLDKGRSRKENPVNLMQRLANWSDQEIVAYAQVMHQAAEAAKALNPEQSEEYQQKTVSFLEVLQQRSVQAE